LRRKNSDKFKFKYPRIKDETTWRWDGESERHIVFVSPKYFWAVLNPVAAEILYMCDGCHTVNQMTDVLKSRYKDVSEEELERDLLDCLRELERCGLLIEAHKLEHTAKS
jgi:hypothetical protein